MEGGKKREKDWGEERRRSDDDAERPNGFSAIPVTGCSASTGGLGGYKSWPRASLHAYIRITLNREHLFQVAYPGNKIINQDNHNHTAQGQRNTVLDQTQPNHHIPVFPTQSVLNSYPARARSESRLRSSLHLHIPIRTLHKTLTPSNGTQSCYAVDVAQHDLCRTPVAAQKQKPYARWYHGRAA